MDELQNNNDIPKNQEIYLEKTSPKPKNHNHEDDEDSSCFEFIDATQLDIQEENDPKLSLHPTFTTYSYNSS